MSLLIFAYRKLDIIHRKNDLNYRLMNLTRKLNDMQQYASSIGDGSLSMQDMMQMPSSMFGRSMTYMTYAHNNALMGAQRNMSQMGPQMQMQMTQMQDPNAQAMYQNWIFKNLYQQEREKAGKIEAKLLNEQEKQITMEKEKIETQLKILEQEMESVKAGEKAGIQEWKVEYA